MIAGSNLRINCGALLAVGPHFLLHHYGYGRFSSKAIFLSGTVTAVLASLVIRLFTAFGA